jgi:hypothetical protein
MNKLLGLLFTGLLIVASIAWAGSEAQKISGPSSNQNSQAQTPERFKRMKEIRMHGLNTEISILQQIRGCMQKAQDHMAMENCMQQGKQSMQDLRDQQKQAWQVINKKS